MIAKILELNATIRLVDTHLTMRGRVSYASTRFALGVKVLPVGHEDVIACHGQATLESVGPAVNDRVLAGCTEMFQRH